MKMINFIAVVLIAVVLQGCATGGSEVMVAEREEVAIEAPLGSSVIVIVTGGDNVVTTEEFTEALIESIKEAEIFETVVDADAEYNLTVVLLSMTGSTFGLAMNGSVSSLWTLRKAGEELWRSEIKTTAKATVGESFVGATRVKIAIKRAAQNSIEEGLTQLGKINRK